MYRSEELHEEKDRIASGLSAATSPDLIRRALEFAISDDVRSQDSPRPICYAAANPKGRELAWEFYKANAKFFEDRY